MKHLITIALCFMGLSIWNNPVSGQSLPADKSLSGLYNSIKSEVNASRMELMLNEMMKKPEEGNNKILIEVSMGMTAVAFAGEGHVEKATYWANKIEDTGRKTGTFSEIIDKLMDIGKFKEAEAIINATTDPQRFNQKLGIIRYKQGKYKEALSYLSGESGRRGGGNSEIYALALVGAGEQEKAYTEMNKQLLISANRSETFKAAAQKVFVKKFGNNQRYKFLLDSMANVEHEKMLAKIAKMETNQPAPDFELKDLNGKSVSLKSLRGKIVILDFWATWCQPCVASFPGMQKAVDYYKNDKDVVFMFIHTMEKSPTADEDARKMLEAKKNHFDVYMDWKDKTTGKSPVLTAYRVSGIPAKFFIDKEGVIRYKNTGYIGEDEAIPEIKTIVDKIR